MAWKPIPKHVIIIASSVVIMLAGASISVWMAVYRAHSDATIIRSIASTLSLPVARVGGVNVSYEEYMQHVDVQRAYFSSEAAVAIGIAHEINNTDRQEALERAIRMTAVALAAEKAGIIVTDLDVERGYTYLATRSASSTTEGDFATVLQEVGMTQEVFKRLVVRPALLEDALKSRRVTDTNDPEAFGRELDALLAAPETKRYLSFDGS